MLPYHPYTIPPVKPSVLQKQVNVIYNSHLVVSTDWWHPGNQAVQVDETNPLRLLISDIICPQIDWFNLGWFFITSGILPATSETPAPGKLFSKSSVKKKGQETAHFTKRTEFINILNEVISKLYNFHLWCSFLRYCIALFKWILSC